MLLCIVSGVIPSTVTEVGKPGGNHVNDLKNLEVLFGEKLLFGGASVMGNKLEWLEAEGEDLELLDNLFSGALFPRVVLGVPRMKRMRWYGDTARSLLWSWCAMVRDFQEKAPQVAGG